MAYQKTKGRGVYVQPVGMPNLRGFSDMANAINGLSDLTSSIGTDIRKQEYNDMLIKAEQDGRTAGVRYNDKNELVPLVDTTYASAMNAFGTSEQKGLQAAFRKSAIDTYAAALTLDARSSANNALVRSPTDPESIVGAANGYLEKLQSELDPDAFSAVAPRVNIEFATAANQARAGRIKQAREDSIDTNKQVLDHYYDQLGVLATVGVGSDPESQRGTQKRYQEIINLIEDSYSVLKTNGVSDADISKLRRGGSARVALFGAKAVAEKIYYMPEDQGGGFANALAFAIQSEDTMLTEEAQKEAGIGINSEDVKSISDAMQAHVRELKAITDANVVANEKSQIDLTESYKLKIQTGQGVTEKDILSLPIDDGRKSTLLTAYRTNQKSESQNREAAKTEEEKLNKEVFTGHVANYVDMTLTPALRDEARLKAEAMINVVDAPTWKSFVTTRNAEIKKSIDAAADNKFAIIEHEMSSAGGYKLNPKDFAAMENDLIAKGFVGEGKKMSLSSWRAKVRQYENDWKKNDIETKKNFSAVSSAKNGEKLEPDQKKRLTDLFAGELQADGTGSVFYHQDENIRDQNFEQAVAFSSKYKILHPQLVNVLGGLSNAAADEETYNNVMKLYNKTLMTLTNGINNKGTAGLGVGSLTALKIMSDAGINNSLFAMAREVGIKEFVSLQASNQESTSGNRVLNSIKTTYPNLDSAIAANFSKAVETSSVMETILNNLGVGSERDARHLAILDKLEDSSNGGSLSSAIINDPRLGEYLRQSTIATMVQNNLPANDKGIQLAIRESIVDISDSIGLNIDENGEATLGFNTWYSHAAQSLGANADVVVGGVEGAFFRELRRQAVRPDVNMFDPELARQIADGEGTIEVVPDIQYGKNQTYSAYITIGDRKTQIIQGFRYDFKRSMDYKVMQIATNRIKNSTVKKFFSRLSILKPSIVEEVSEQILEDYEENSDFITIGDGMSFRGVLETMNSAVNSVKPVMGFFNQNAGVIDTTNIDEEDVKILRAWAQGKFNSEEEFLEAIK